MNARWWDDPQAPRLFALGSVTEQSARMEWVLRSIFCALIGSKYAAIVAGGQSTSWLLDNCRALVKANLEMTPEQKEELQAAFAACAAANEHRNFLVHGVPMIGDDEEDEGGRGRARSRRRTDVPDIAQWTPDAIDEVGYQLFYATGLLLHASNNAISPEARMMDRALAQERQRREQDVQDGES